MFDKILIANRGEIARRVMKTARKLGVKTVAIYSDADVGAFHMREADEAVHIGGAAAADSYLCGDKIINAALATGAQAIHPGYGFLSENADFAEAVMAAGLVFIGPSARAIRQMGLKDNAKRIMADAGVPIVAGYHGADQNDAVLAGEAGKIGYPVLIKAVAGGGGKGMREVHGADGFDEALQSARAEAKHAFGNADVLVEKLITQPRHIEMQIFGDGTRAVHLFERDCSLQRRHQKVIEEAPAPDMSDVLRTAMGQAAIRAAEAIGYAGAGTVEFIVDGTGPLREDGFWFMEMNTRLQVEHPVTEAITGIDLVEWQLRVAAGEPLPMTQNDIQIAGHSFEARLYAEDVAAGFLPATGRLDHLVFPRGVRIETAVEQGDEISPHYDPMIAKLIVHGADRGTALSRLTAALEGLQIAGLRTNRDFLLALAKHDGFGRGEVDTGLIGRDLDTLIEVAPPSMADIAAAVILAAELQQFQPHQGFAIWSPLRHTVALQFDGEAMNVGLTFVANDRVELHFEGDKTDLFYDGSAWRHGARSLPDAVMFGREITVFADQILVFICPDPTERHAIDEAAQDAVMAPMPGLVRAVFVEVGARVKAGDRMMVLEAMKMEHALLAPRDGRVLSITLEAGDQAVAGQELIRLEPLDEGAE